MPKVSSPAKLIVYALILLIAVSVCAATGVSLRKNANGFDKSLSLIKMPGTADLVFRLPNRYIVHHIYQIAMADSLYTTGSALRGFQCALTSKSTGEKIAIEEPKKESRAMSGEYFGKGAYEFEITERGEYQMTCGFPDDDVHGQELFFIKPADRAAHAKTMVEQSMIVGISAVCSFAFLLLVLAEARKMAG